MIDHLSNVIRDKYPGRPKQGEDRVYKLLFTRVTRDSEGNSRLIAPYSRVLPSSYVIFDPVDETRKTIRLIKDVVPAGPNSVKDTMNIPGRVEFRRSAISTIRITHDNYPTMMDIDKFLFFAPWCDVNATQPFFIRHKFGFFFTREDKQGKARKSVQEAKLVAFAHNRILEMSSEEVSILVMALKLGNAKAMSPDERVDALIKHYSKPKNAQNFQALTEENELKLRAMIKQAQKHQIIRIDQSGQQWIWTKGEQVICNRYPGKSVDESLLLFFATPFGHDTELILKELVVAAEKGGKAKATNGKTKAEDKKAADKTKNTPPEKPKETADKKET